MAAKTAARTAAPRTAPAQPAKTIGDGLADREEETGEEREGGLTRGVTLTGLALGVTLVTYLYSDGIHPRMPGLPTVLGYLAGLAVVVLVALAAATAVSYALRWHHREIAAWSWGTGKQAVTWGYGHGRRHGARLGDRLTAWAGPRWQDRRRPAGIAGGHGDGQAGDGPAAPPGGQVIDDSGRRDDLASTPAHANDGDTSAGHVPAPAVGAPAPAVTARDGDEMTTSTAGPAAGRNRNSGRKVPAPYRGVISMIDDFTPENDAELHELLQGVAAGEHDVGQALQDLYERCTAADVRVGKAGMVATHNAADAVTDASGEVAAASKALEQYYAGVSDEVAGGVELPRDGDFITGEGAGG